MVRRFSKLETRNSELNNPTLQKLPPSGGSKYIHTKAKSTQWGYNIYRGIAMNSTADYRNHFGRGSVETHPIFNTKYLAENIASLIESIIVLVIYFYIAIFSLDTIAQYFGIDNAATAMVGNYVNRVLSFLQIPHNLFSSIGGLAFMILIYILIRRYFNHVKFNLHPRD
jgi:hypothetical protein